METNENARVHIFTRRADYGLKEKLLADAREYLEDAGMEPRLAEEVHEEMRSENDLDDENMKEVPVKFFVEQCVDELSVSKCMREQRIVVDLRKTTDLYLRISCISTAIPQILMTSSQYMVHGKNGLQIKNLSELEESLRYYLDGMSNWNEAMVYSYEMGKNFTTARLIEDWKGVIGSIG
jgi:accessory secretory protein Asp1